MKVLCVIPARYGSTRLAGKPLIEFNNKPVIQYVYENAKNTELVNNVVVATDDKRIYDKVTEFGGNAIMTSENCKSGTDRIVETVKKNKYSDFDIIVNVQGDEPLLGSVDINNTIKALINSNADVSTLASKCKNLDEVNDSNSVKVVFDNNNKALYFSRHSIPFHRETEIIPEHFHKHIGIYVFKKDVLLKFSELKPSVYEEFEKLEQLRLLQNGYSISLAFTENNIIGLDTLEDKKMLDVLLY